MNSFVFLTYLGKEKVLVHRSLKRGQVTFEEIINTFFLLQVKKLNSKAIKPQLLNSVQFFDAYASIDIVLYLTLLSHFPNFMTLESES